MRETAPEIAAHSLQGLSPHLPFSHAPISRLGGWVAGFALYGEQLKKVYLFGSYAREEADEESDVDVLIVLDRVDDDAREIDRTSYLMAELSLYYDRSISCVYASEPSWRAEQTMFFLHVRAEAIPV